ncbi:fatty acid desaturase [Acaryochloris sp. CCMEE 5410]|uniref:acyl-CoA desaturase n=1 Tax=Acaryochloris sp. CCMEE 5410 TaxID=310037 RepID=UPI0002484CF0|nr:fatty acid desaturase [Acaryochloris sp. CCMEE 5410]KAI9130792.1 fatty acid desaturase [Acaryochloris sp. CCMEE 5410]
MTTNPVVTAPAGSPALSWTNVGFFGAFHLLAISLAPHYFSWSALGVALFLHWLLGGIGICLGYHRLLSHRSFRVPKVLEYAIATLGSLAIQGGPIFWVSGHRQHHAHTEHVNDDPYSAQRGFWWSHILWIFYPRPEYFDAKHYRKNAPDLARQPFYRWLDRNFLMLQIPLAAVLYALGGWSFVVYGIFVRAVILWHSTWLVNSASHMWGYRTFESNDGAQNLWWVSLLTYGEGWHNNHHSYPHVAKSGYRWWEIDFTWWAICVLKQMGLAKKIVTYPKSLQYVSK